MSALVAIYLLGLVVTSRVVAKMSRSEIPWFGDPVTLMTGVWIVGLSLYSLPLFQYREEISLSAMLYIMAMHTLFCFGAVIGGIIGSGSVQSGTRANARTKQFTVDKIPFGLVLLVALVGLLGVTSVLVNGLSRSSIGFLERFDSNAMREVRLETFAASAGLIAQGPFAAFEQFSALAYVFLGLMLVAKTGDYSARRQTLLLVLSAGTLFLVMFNQLFIRGGRMDLFVFALYAVIVLGMTKDSHLRAVLLGAYRRHRVAIYLIALPVILVALYYFAVVFVNNRGGGKALPLDGLAAYHRMKLHPAIAGFVEGNPSLEALMLSVSYLVVPLTTLSFYFDLPNSAFGGPYWGQYNFQYVSGFIMRRLDMARDWVSFWEIRETVWASLSMHGYGTNVWATLFRDIAIDFGWGGVAAFVFLLGLGSQWLASSASPGYSREKSVAFGFVAVFLIFSFAHSMFFINSVFPPFVYISMIYLARRAGRCFYAK